MVELVGGGVGGGVVGCGVEVVGGGVEVVGGVRWWS